MADELTQVDAIPAPEGPAEPPKATEPTPPDHSWLNDVPPETLEWMKTKGVHGYKKWNQENMALKEKQAKLDAALSRLSEKPRPQADAELGLLKSQLGRLVDAGKLTTEEANSEYARAQAEFNQPKPLTEDKLLEVLSKREIEREMKLAEREILEKSNGRLEAEDAARILDAYVSSGMDVDEAKEKVLGLVSLPDQAAKETAKEAVKKVVEPKSTKIVTPGVTSSGTQTNSDDEILERVKELARKGVPAF